MSILCSKYPASFLMFTTGAKASGHTHLYLSFPLPTWHLCSDFGALAGPHLSELLVSFLLQLPLQHSPVLDSVQ